MNLVIDQGNTKAKAAFFEGETLVAFNETEVLTTSLINEWKTQYDIHHCILSAVKPLPASVLSFLSASFDLFVDLTSHTPLPFRIGYKTPHTLGCDRVAAIAGAFEQTGSQAVIVIDAGTAITYDFMNENGVFEGGNIAPGIHLRLRALHEFTGKLPEVAPCGDLPLVGYSTETAIRSGVVNGICFEIEGFIAKIKATHPSVLVF
ncbi:MAG: type III pantothenate kinase, partial [Bacteroidales bacterium]